MNFVISSAKSQMVQRIQIQAKFNWENYIFIQCIIIAKKCNYDAIFYSYAKNILTYLDIYYFPPDLFTAFLIQTNNYDILI